MYISDTEIKQLVQTFNNGSDELKSVLIEKLSPYIYSFPMRVYHMDEDTAGDFYVYIIEHFEEMIARYIPMKAQFITWFTVCLRNRMRNWQRLHYESSQEYIFDEQTLNYIAAGKPSAHTDNTPVLNAADTISVSPVQQAITALPPLERICLRLQYYSIEQSDIETIAELNNQSIQEVITTINHMTEQSDSALEHYNILRDRLNTAFYRLQKTKTEIYTCSDTLRTAHITGLPQTETAALEKNICRLELRIEKRRKQITLLLKKLLKLSRKYSISDIARLLNIKENTVSQHLSRARKHLVSYLQNNEGAVLI